jgi:hypothetical protein
MYCCLTRSTRWKPVVGFFSGLWELVCFNQENMADQQEARVKSTGATQAKLHVHVSLEKRYICNCVLFLTTLSLAKSSMRTNRARKNAHKYTEAVK